MPSIEFATEPHTEHGISGCLHFIVILCLNRSQKCPGGNGRKIQISRHFSTAEWLIFPDLKNACKNAPKTMYLSTI